MEALPSNLLMYIFEFLSLQDCHSLNITCKYFSHIMHSHNRFWVRECLTKNMSFELELYSNTYDSEEYKSLIRNKIYHLQKIAWKQLLEEGETHKKALASVLAQIAEQKEVESFMKNFYQILKEPNLPIINLKRETIICTTQTFFQSRLSEILYEDTGLICNNRSLFSNYPSLIDELRQYEKKIFQEMLLHDKNDFKKARWYNFDKKDSDLDDTISFEDKNDIFLELAGLPELNKISNVSTEDLKISKDRNCLLINLYENLCNTLRHYCGVIHKYLVSLDDVYLLLAEYTVRWRVYVCSMFELERIFAAFTELMNKNYETLFEGYPCFPKFSIWRLMTKLWMNEVYEKSNLNLILTESFLKIMSNHREANMKNAFNENNLKLNTKEQEIFGLAKNLYVSLKTKKKQKSFKCQYNVELVNSAHRYFKASELERDLLFSMNEYSFLQSILDISLNEVNVHYLDCADIPVNYPYCELEEALLYQSKCQFSEFYKEYQQLFKDSPEYFCHLLKSDNSLLSKILIEKTSVKLEKIQQQQGLQLLKEFIDQKLDGIEENELKKFEKQIVLLNEQGDEIGEFVESFIGQILEERSSCQPCESEQDFDETLSIFLLKEAIKVNEVQKQPSKAYIKAIILCLEAISSNVRQSLEYFKHRQEYLKSVQEKDQYTRQFNIDKNIPCDMGDVDCLFYDLEKNVELALLERLYEDYLMFKKEQEKEEEKQKKNNDFGEDVINLENGFEAGPDLPNFDDIDLMNLESLSLQRA